MPVVLPIPQVQEQIALCPIAITADCLLGLYDQDEADSEFCRAFAVE